MLHSLTFKKDYRCFKSGEYLPFQPGINLLVGDQGSGKSTVFQLIRNLGKNEEIVTAKVDRIQMFSFDFEHDNPRIATVFNEKVNYGVQAAMLFSSHGQTVNALLKFIQEKKDCLVLLDEPDLSLSIRSCIKLMDVFREAASHGCQIIATVHNMATIKEMPDCLSLEHRKWMSSDDFINSHYGKE